MINIAKIINDKYYTPVDLANYCWDKVYEVIGEENISEIIEPSCGNGAFYNHPKYIPHLGYDIEPECNFHNVIKGNFLEQNIKYLWGRLVIGNPPFGRGNSLAMSFYKKSVKIADYIAFILPISQFNNNVQLYDFDLIYSEDLGEKEYSNIKLHCCFNIYKRPNNGINKKPNYKLNDIEIVEVRNRQGILNKYIDINNYDISICNRGNGTIGKILYDSGKYNSELHIKIINKKYREQIINIIKTIKWKELCTSISSAYIPQWQVYKYIKEQIPEIQ